MENEKKEILTGKCSGCSHRAYDGSPSAFCLGCKRQRYPDRDSDYHETKPDLYYEDVLIP